MATVKRNKLMSFLNQHKAGTLCLSPWLEAQGISRDLQKHYRKAGWLESVGRGAYKRPGEQIEWEGALYALQEQAGLEIHIGGLTALAKRGSNQYIRLGGETVFLFSPLKVKLPAWFNEYEWGVRVEHINTGFLPGALGIGEITEMGFSSPASPFNLKISDPERAIMECLYLAPKNQSLVETYEILEGLVNLRPKIVQQLLEECRSIKVKRLFLYMAEKAGHKWMQFVDSTKIELGTGDRSIVPDGIYVAKHRISVPKELEQNDYPRL